MENLPPPSAAADSSHRLYDSYGRLIHDLRVSVTDRCNYRCVYCRTGEHGTQFAELRGDEYLHMIRLFVSLGITKLRLTGGEPLLRRGIGYLVGELAKLRTPDGHKPQIAMTTNGHLLADLAPKLKEAGLDRVTVSMDAVEPELFEKITRVPGSFASVLAGVRAAQAAGLNPVKVNCVLMRGFNDNQIEAFARFAREENVIVRFIEFMPLDEGRTWKPETVVPPQEIIDRISRVLPLVPLDPNEPSETARRFGFADGHGEIGIIAPVSQPFCGQCSRIRLTSDGKIRTCLFSQIDHDLYGRLRAGTSDDALRTYITHVVNQKEARHHIGEPGFLKPSRAMVHIGG